MMIIIQIKINKNDSIEQKATDKACRNRYGSLQETKDKSRAQAKKTTGGNSVNRARKENAKRPVLNY